MGAGALSVGSPCRRGPAKDGRLGEPGCTAPAPTARRRRRASGGTGASAAGGGTDNRRSADGAPLVARRRAALLGARPPAGGADAAGACPGRGGGLHVDAPPDGRRRPGTRGHPPVKRAPCEPSRACARAVARPWTPRSTLGPGRLPQGRHNHPPARPSLRGPAHPAAARGRVRAVVRPGTRRCDARPEAAGPGRRSRRAVREGGRRGDLSRGVSVTAVPPGGWGGAVMGWGDRGVRRGRPVPGPEQ